MKLIKIIFSIAVIASLASCKKVLETEPENQLDVTTRFKELEDYNYVLTGAYAAFRSTNYYGSTDEAPNGFALMPDMMADNFTESKTESFGGSSVLTDWYFAKNEGQIEGIWTGGYRIIAQANLAIGGINQPIDQFAATEPKKVNRIKGQALAIRAMVHFDLLRYWAENYDRNSTGPCIPYVTQFDQEAKPTRLTVKQVYDNIETDLKTARVLLQTANIDQTINPGTSTVRAYMDRFTVDAILARMYLYSNQMDSAVKYASTVIAQFPLAPDFDTFLGIWTDANRQEVVWGATFEVGQGIPGFHAYFPQNNVSSYNVDSTLLTLYDQNNDFRFYAYFTTYPDNSGTDRDILIKFLAKESQLDNPDGVVNWKAFRVAEMYLIRAEAHARKAASDLTAAMNDLNTLRRARIAGYVNQPVPALAVLLNAIAIERRKELVGEGHRFFDLKRTTRVVSRAPGRCVACTLAASRKEWTFPIPQGEVDANPNIGAQIPAWQ